MVVALLGLLVPIQGNLLVNFELELVSRDVPLQNEKLSGKTFMRFVVLHYRINCEMNCVIE